MASGIGEGSVGSDCPGGRGGILQVGSLPSGQILLVSGLAEPVIKQHDGAIVRPVIPCSGAYLASADSHEEATLAPPDGGVVVRHDCVKGLTSALGLGSLKGGTVCTSAYGTCPYLLPDIYHMWGF
ncbi:MAG: hypothetical protein FRX49_02493 [Trebouxia sp. A1-2]|nr:MAG: hypothetical protein FRX49_02493 [Trebouxia sp. A1-2]